MENILLWIIFGILIGSLGSYLLYRAIGREEEEQRAAVIGALIGAVGNLVLLLPLWAYLYRQNRPALQPQLALAGEGALSLRGGLAKPQPAIPEEAAVSRRGVHLRPLWRFLLYAFLIFMVILYLLPMYTVVTTSLKTPVEAGKLNQVWQLPSELNWESYTTAFDVFGPKLRNSLILTISATVISAVMGSLNGYVLAKWKFLGANIIFPLMLFGMFIPYQSILIPLFQFIQDIDLGGTIQGLIIAHVVYGLPITTLIFRNYYAEVPTEMLEAGSIDGAGFFGIYRWIVFPLSLPGFVVVIIWQFTQIWNEFLFAVTLTSQATQPITVALAQLAGGEAVRWNLPMAGAILAAVPTLLIYIVLGRYFIRGLLAGSVKG